MKEKLTSILRHLLSGAAAWAVDTGLLAASEADELLRMAVAAGVIVLSRLAMWAVEKYAPSLKEILKLGSSSSSVVVLLGSLAAAGAIGLTGCADYGLSGTVYLRDPDTGAKGGLEFVPGQDWPSGFVRVPITNDEGEVVGWADLEAGGAAELTVPITVEK